MTLTSLMFMTSLVIISKHDLIITNQSRLVYMVLFHGMKLLEQMHPWDNYIYCPFNPWSSCNSIPTALPISFQVISLFPTSSVFTLVSIFAPALSAPFVLSKYTEFYWVCSFVAKITSRFGNDGNLSFAWIGFARRGDCLWSHIEGRSTKYGLLCNAMSHGGYNSKKYSEWSFAERSNTFRTSSEDAFPWLLCRGAHNLYSI